MGLDRRARDHSERPAIWPCGQPTTTVEHMCELRVCVAHPVRAGIGPRRSVAAGGGVGPVPPAAATPRPSAGSLDPVLVLSRRVGESVVIGDGPDAVTVTVLEVRGDVVRVGIDAPRSIRVNRAELVAELAEANTESASPSPDAVASLTEALRKRP